MFLEQILLKQMLLKNFCWWTNCFRTKVVKTNIVLRNIHRTNIVVTNVVRTNVVRTNVARTKVKQAKFIIFKFTNQFYLSSLLFVLYLSNNSLVRVKGRKNVVRAVAVRDKHYSSKLVVLMDLTQSLKSETILFSKLKNCKISTKIFFGG